MPERKINLHFFQLTTENENTDDYKSEIEEIKKLFSELPDSYDPIIFSDSRVSIYGPIEKKNGIYFGTLIRTQISEIPPSYDESASKLEALPLTDNQGLAYATCFLYDPEVRMLMIQSVRNGVGVGTFCSFVKRNFDIRSLVAAVVINPQEYSDFLEMTSIKKFQVKIARLQDGSVFKSSKKALGQITHSADDTNTETLEYALSVGHKKGSLTLGTIRKFTSELLKFKKSDELQVLKVTGSEDDDSPSSTIDFIKQRLVDSISVEKERLIGSFEIADHHKKMLTLYLTNHKKALNIYKAKRPE